MFNSDMVDKILINPITKGAQKLLILSGYATPCNGFVAYDENKGA